MIACKFGHSAVASLLISATENFRDYNTKNRAGFSPLHYAYKSKCFDIADLIVKRGAFIDVTNKVKRRTLRICYHLVFILICYFLEF